MDNQYDCVTGSNQASLGDARLMPRVKPWTEVDGCLESTAARRGRTSKVSSGARHTQAPRSTNTVASARCHKVTDSRQPFQRFRWQCGKPLKRLGTLAAHLHRAEAAVLMRDPRPACEIWRPRASAGQGPAANDRIREAMIKLRFASRLFTRPSPLCSISRLAPNPSTLCKTSNSPSASC
jgi:hypothetical protein